MNISKLDHMLGNVKKQYKLKRKATRDGWVYMKVRKGMYGLPHEGLLVQELLEKLLATNRYTQSTLTSGL